MKNFLLEVDLYNKMYNLPRPATPTLPVNTVDMLKNFKSILTEEVQEVDEIIKMVETGDSTRVVVLSHIGDWLGDMAVYCHTQARQFGLPMEAILEIIMDSNFSKLGEDGKAIYDSRGKVEKGPNYWAPEKKIEQEIRDIQSTSETVLSADGKCPCVKGSDN